MNDKEDLVYIHTQWNLSHNKEQNLVIWNNMDGPGGYYTK